MPMHGSVALLTNSTKIAHHQANVIRLKNTFVTNSGITIQIAILNYCDPVYYNKSAQCGKINYLKMSIIAEVGYVIRIIILL